MSVVTPFLPDVLERQRRITVDEYHRMIDAGILRTSMSSSSPGRSLR
jgi:hypothetical protein